jgi:RNA polymerase sigma-70 factor (ECF subfamily)
MAGASSTSKLLAQARAGDPAAAETLFALYLPRLRRWASGRLPRWARDIADTTDLVHDALLQTFKRLPDFEPTDDGALQAYLRQAVLNRIKDEIRRRYRRGQPAALASDLPAAATSPLELTIQNDALDRYDAALGRLRDEEREVLVGRLELGLSYDELATATGRPSAEAARKAAQRALVRLLEEMNERR